MVDQGLTREHNNTGLSDFSCGARTVESYRNMAPYFRSSWTNRGTPRDRRERELDSELDGER